MQKLKEIRDKHCKQRCQLTLILLMAPLLLPRDKMPWQGAGSLITSQHRPSDPPCAGNHPVTRVSGALRVLGLRATGVAAWPGGEPMNGKF